MKEPTGGKVLLDAPGGETERFDRSMLERLGHPVAVCSGPEVKHLCPILSGEGCQKFDEAHGVVFLLDLDRAQHRAILERYRALGKPDLPIRVVCSPEQATKYAAMLADVEVWTHELTAADLDGFAAEVEAADRFA